MSKLFWMALQAGIVGLCIWAWQTTPGPNKPPLHSTIFVGVLLAFLATALPFIVKDVVQGQWSLWSGKLRGWRLRRQEAKARIDERADHVLSARSNRRVPQPRLNRR